MKNVLEYLEQTGTRSPHKPAFFDEAGFFTFSDMLDRARRAGSALCGKTAQNAPVPVLADKGNLTLAAFFGAVYAGGFYSPLNPALPEARLKTVLSALSASVLVTDKAHLPLAQRIRTDEDILLIEDLILSPVNEAALARIRREMIDIDPLYANFTSGSTGTPKGVLVSHRSVIDFIEAFVPLFGIDSTDVIGNQAPPDFDVSVKDIYSCLKTGASLVLIPQAMFLKPTALMDLLCEREVTTLIWAVSALGMLTAFHALDYKTPASIRRVLFSGEVMPQKVLRDLTAHLPDAAFVNLYGPTEITCNCLYHIVDKSAPYPDGLPLGVPFPNERVFLLDDAGRRVTKAQTVGEICVAGACLALGYLNAPELTERAFSDDPSVGTHPLRIYHTGDMGKYGEDGLLYFCGRRDLQIKYRGHRIELQEIELIFSRLPGVSQCCCIYDEERQKLLAFYIGDAEKSAVFAGLKAALPTFMLPGAVKRLSAFPLNKNGKTDRKKLLQDAGEGRI